MSRIKKSLVKEIIENLGYATDSTAKRQALLITPPPSSRLFPMPKIKCLPPIQYSEFVNREFQQVVFKVYSEYEKRLKETGALDFDDLLIKAVLLFKRKFRNLKKMAG